LGARKKSIRKEIYGIFLIAAFAIIVALIIGQLGNENRIPLAYLQPIYVLIVVASAYLWIRIITAILEKIVEPTIGATKTQGIKNLFYVAAGIILVAVISSVYNFNLAGVLVGAGFAGIVLGLAAQQVLGNIFAGLSLLAARPFDIGDRITLTTASYSLLGGTYPRENVLNGFTGVVTDIGIFFTKMMFDDGTPAVFPNSVVIGSMAVNHTRITARTVRVRMDLDKRIEYNNFKSKFLEAMKKFEIIDSERSYVAIVDVGTKTYQIVMVVWAKVTYEEPVKTIMIQEALKIQSELDSQLPPQQ
jgi:small conductance mechanosensitive channel